MSATYEGLLKTRERERVDFLGRVTPIRALLEDARITDISLNEPAQVGGKGKVWADYNGVGYADTGVELSSLEAELVVRAIANGVTWSPAHPFVSCQAVGGEYRLEAQMPPATRRAPVFTIRKYLRRRVLLSDYVATGELSQRAATTLSDAVKLPSTVLTAGETGAGKTTLTNALLLEAGTVPGHRILTIEDTPELEQPNELALQLVAQRSGGFTYSEAIKSALRHKPSYIVLGELRPGGDEAFEAICAWRSGHRGMATIHAESAEDMPHTLLSLCRQSTYGRMLTEHDVARYVRILVHVRRVNGRRQFDVRRLVRWDGTSFVTERLVDDESD